jgi:hypothetical protein
MSVIALPERDRALEFELGRARDSQQPLGFGCYDRCNTVAGCAVCNRQGGDG